MRGAAGHRETALKDMAEFGSKSFGSNLETVSAGNSLERMTVDVEMFNMACEERVTSGLCFSLDYILASFVVSRRCRDCLEDDQHRGFTAFAGSLLEVDACPLTLVDEGQVAGGNVFNCTVHAEWSNKQSSGTTWPWQKGKSKKCNEANITQHLQNPAWEQ